MSHISRSCSARFYLFMKYAFWTSRSVLVRILGRRRAQRPTNFISKKTHIKRNCLGYRGAADNRAADNNSCPDRRKGCVRGQGTRLDTHRVAQESAGLCKKLGGFALSLAERLPDGLQSSAEDAIKSFSDKLPAIIRRACGTARAGRRAEPNINLLSILKTPLSGVWSTAKQIPSILVGVLPVYYRPPAS